MRHTENIQDIVESRLCLGCGACAYICPQQRITIVDILEEGLRPSVRVGSCDGCTACLDVCPAFENDHRELNRRPGILSEMTPIFGPVLEVWEGHATEDAVRHIGASGGVISALAIFSLEREEMAGVLHIGQDPCDATRNRTKFSRTRAEILANAGSRYAPASACDSLNEIETAHSRCVFIGQPSEVTALRKSARLRPSLHKNVGLAISFFCAGSPSTKGVRDLLVSVGVSPREVQSLQYRGHGWPGVFTGQINGGVTIPEMSYQQSWSYLQAYRPFSTHLTPDGSGEDADISCGDPWYRDVRQGEKGSSLILVRTETGRQIFDKAIQAGYVTAQRLESWKATHSQLNLVAKRGAVGGRIAVMRLLGLRAPRLRGFRLGRNWLRLSMREKLRSTIGTFRRIIARGYFKPLHIEFVSRGDRNKNDTTSSIAIDKSSNA